MKFGPVPLTDAMGGILAHGLTTADGPLKKGTVLTADDLARLRRSGLTQVVIARLDADDTGEDEAAATVAAALAGTNVRLAAAHTGRCNLFAAAAGVAVIDVAAIDQLNRVHEAITVATVPAFAAAALGQMLATVKIIPFAAPAAAVARCRSLAGEAPPLRLAAFQPHRLGLIQTSLPETKPALMAKMAATTGDRLAALGSTLAAQAVVAHNEAAVAAIIARQIEDGCDPILVLGASAITDRRDVIPAAVVALGGEVEHFGMPVDPGNLLLLARIGATRVIGLPGCARSPKLNGFDWVLQRLLAGLTVTAADIMGMGVGGLLSETGLRTARHGRETDHDPAEPEPPRVAAVVLAAGRGRRFGKQSKLLAPFRGRPLVRAAVDSALASQASPVLVVGGHRGDAVEAALAGLPVQVVANPDYDLGMSSSLRVGLLALPEGIDGALVLLGDMPRVTAAHLDRLVAAFTAAGGESVCVPTHGGRRGNPVLWPARYFPRLVAIEGDRGGRALLTELGEAVVEVEMADDGVLIDVDDAAALAQAERADAAEVVSR